MENGLRERKCPPPPWNGAPPTLPMLLGLGMFHPCRYLQGHCLLVSQTLAPSHALFALVFLLTPRFLLQHLHSLFLREFGLSHALHAFIAPVFSVRPPRSLPLPAFVPATPRLRCLLIGLGYLGPQARDTERQQLLLYRRSSANVLS